MSTTPGVIMCRGFSKTILEEFLDEVTVRIANRTTPHEALRQQLDNERYDAVRAVCREVSEGGMALLPPTVVPASAAQVQSHRQDGDACEDA
jgi:hypothetical protein